MYLRMALVLVAFCAAAPALAAAGAVASQAAGLRGLEPARPADAPRRYSVSRETGRTPDPAPSLRPEAAATAPGLVLDPGFFAPLPPTLADPPPATPTRDRQGRPIQQSSPDDAPQV